MAATDRTAREIRLASRPRGEAAASNFAVAEVELPPLAEGQAEVRNLFMSVDPSMRARMNDVKSYTPPFQIGMALEGGAVGEVVASRDPGFAVGDVVTSILGWRDRFVAPASELRKVDPAVKPLSSYLGVLGPTGLTAWAGLTLVDIKAGDRVFVSAAAGATGSVAGQLAKARGARVIGSAGSAEKVRMLVDEFGFDAAFNYKDGPLSAQLKKAAPDGIDVYFDNVGGDHLEAAISAMRLHGRIIICGAISKYNEEAPSPGPRNMAMIIGKRLTLKGFLVFDWFRRMPEFLAEVSPLLASGKLVSRETVVDGLDRAPEALIDLLRGTNVGKMIVKL